jgi:hypothetical protein
MDLVKNIDNLSIAEKISLYNCLYEDLAGKGTEGDTELAHVNKDEMAVLRSMGGSGTINPETNLIQFGGSKSSPPPPTTQTVKQQSTFPEELQPFIKDIFGKGQAIQEKREEDGYTPFTGPRLADFTPDQQAAFEGIRGLVGASEPYFDRSQELVESSAVAPTSESIGTLMNPYIQNVIDVEKREASRQSDISGQNLAGKAAISNAFGGSREAILRAELERNTQQQLGDIQTRGTAAAFEDAQRRFAEQKARESGAASNFMNLGTTAPAAARSELSALEAIGATQQGRSQQGLDIAQQEFEIERTFPERTLQDYSSILRGFTQPLPASTFRQSSTQAPGASFGQTASGIAGLGLTAANLFKPQDGFKFGTASAGGLVGLANGGMVAKYKKGETIGGGGQADPYGLRAYMAMGGIEPETDSPLGEEYPIKDISRLAEAPVSRQSPSRIPTQAPAAPSLKSQQLQNLQSMFKQQNDLSESRKGLLEKERAILAKQKASYEGAPRAELAKALLKIGAGDPSKGFSRLAFEGFADTDANLAKSRGEASALELKEAGLDVSSQEKDIADKQKQIAILTALQKAGGLGTLSVRESTALFSTLSGQDVKVALAIRKTISPNERKAFDNVARAAIPTYVSPEKTEVQTPASDKRPPTSSNNAAKIINMTVKKDK